MISSTATERNDTDWFFSRIESAKARVLVVDYDGTIAHFKTDRQRAFSYLVILDLLRSIMTCCRTRVIVLSSKPAREIPALLQIHPTPEIWGIYGIERLYPDGRYEEVHIDDAALLTLAQAENQLEQEGLGKYIEMKPAAVALHWGGLPPDEIVRIKRKAARILKPLAIWTGLVVRESPAGIELGLATANKSNALREMLSGLDRETPVAYLGNDEAGEDVFRVLGHRGLGVLISPKKRLSAAHLWLRPPDELMIFLHQWGRACGGLQ